MEYGKMKKEILTTFNGEYKPTKLYKELKVLLPELIKWIDNIKFNEGYKKVSHRGQSAEAKVFVEVYKNLPEEYVRVTYSRLYTNYRKQNPNG